MDNAELRPVTTNDLEKVPEHLKEGKSVAPVTVRHLLIMFGNSRRGYWVVNRIRNRLKKLGLRTEPDFEQAYIDGSIRFKLAESPPSVPQWQEAGAPQQIIEIEAVVAGVVDPTLRLSRLAAANKSLISVKPDALLAHAVTEMMNHEFSQLPVMTGERDVKGVISWTSIGTRLSNGLQPKFVREAMDPAIEATDDVSLFAAIPIVVKHDYLLVRAPDRRVVGIITASDLGLQFQQLAEPFLLLGEIENHIRRIIDRGKFAVEELKAAADSRDADREIQSAEDMSFGEYIRLLQNEVNWQKTRLKLDRVTFCSYLDDVRRIRNDVMHFDPDGVDEEDLEKVRRLASMLQRLVAIASP